MDRSEKAREDRLRLMAKRQRLNIQKSRQRDVRAVGYGLYRVIDPYTNVVVAGGWRARGTLRPERYSMTLDDVEAFLLADRGKR